jgi:hypothetical protein
MVISPPNVGVVMAIWGHYPRATLNGAFQQAMELITQWVSNSKNDDKKPQEESGFLGKKLMRLSKC